MRRLNLLLTGLCLFIMSASAFAQRVDVTRTPQKTSKVLYADILEKLRSGAGNEHAVSLASKELVRSIKAHGLYLAITDQERKNLVEAGATKKLLHAIDKASRVREKQIQEMNRLYQIVLDNYKFSDRQKLTAAINAAKEFVARFGAEEIAEPNTRWLKHILPRFEQRLQKLDSIR